MLLKTILTTPFFQEYEINNHITKPLKSSTSAKCNFPPLFSHFRMKKLLFFETNCLVKILPYKKIKTFWISLNDEFDSLITIKWKACATKVCYECVGRDGFLKRSLKLALKILLYKIILNYKIILKTITNEHKLWNVIYSCFNKTKLQ